MLALLIGERLNVPSGVLSLIVAPQDTAGSVTASARVPAEARR